MKNLLLLLILSCLSLLGNAQTPGWLWAQGAGGNNMDMAGFNTFGRLDPMAVDAFGNIYVAGTFRSSTITFGAASFSNNSNSNGDDIFLVKYDPNGNVIWAKTAGGLMSETVTAVAVDSSNDVYICGTTNMDTITFDGVSLYNPAAISGFLVKFSSAGLALWGTTIGTQNMDVINGVTTDHLGDVYITGSFQSPTITIGSTILTNSGTSDIFIAKYSSSGQPYWAVSAAGVSVDDSWAIQAHPSGDVIIAGRSYSPSLSFGANTISTGGSPGDLLLARCTPAGSWVWASSTGGAALELPAALAVGGNGDIVMAGYYTSPTLSFGSTTLTNGFANSADAFIARYDASGAPLWATAVSSGTNADEIAEGVVIDANGDLYVVGMFEGPSVTAGSFTLTKTGTRDGFVIHYGTAGSVISAMHVSGGTGTSFHSANIALDPIANICLGGSFMQSMTFSPYSLTAAGSADVFVAKYGVPCLLAPQPPGNITGPAGGCAGIPLTYSVPPVPGASSYTWTLPGGWTGVSTSNTIIATAGASGGTISVSAVNVCGNSAPATISVTSAPVPAPVITQNGLLLSTATGQGSYQWYLNNQLIAGATNSTYTVTQSGNYSLSVTNSAGCTGWSGSIAITVTGISDPLTAAIRIYPQPARDEFVLRYEGILSLRQVRITDISGKDVSIELHRLSGRELMVRMPGVSPGFYILTATDGERLYRSRLELIR